jgi:hypothetical protein
MEMIIHDVRVILANNVLQLALGLLLMLLYVWAIALSHVDDSFNLVLIVENCTLVVGIIEDI